MRLLARFFSSCSLLFVTAANVGCSDRDPAPIDLPPAVPGTACAPNEQRCSQTRPSEIEICRSDGRDWLILGCASGATCDPATVRCVTAAEPCTPASSRCSGSPGTAARMTCRDDGNGWLDDSCPGDQVCEPSSAQCREPVCRAGESRCDGGPTDPARSTCSDSRLRFESTPCDSSASCVPTEAGAKCVSRVCTPGETTCSSDHTAVMTCDSPGIALIPTQSCQATEACVSGQCVPSQTPLGEVVIVGADDLPLSPGRYALAIVDLDTSGDGEIPFPYELTGTFADPPGGSTASPAVSPPFPRCGTPALVRANAISPQGSALSGFPAGFPSSPQQEDVRTFYVPDFDNGGVVVFPRSARLRAVGVHFNLWEDETASAPGTLLPDALILDLIHRLDDGVAPRNEALFGAPTDVDANNRIDILFTDLLPNASASAFVFPQATLFASGSPDATFDFGEVIYTQGLTDGMEPAPLAAILAHELQHLAYFGRRLTPYLNDSASVPEWIDDDIYATEGLANLALAWSGQAHVWPMVAALQQPEQFSLWRLMTEDSILDPAVNFASYGYGALVLGYLFDQAGGASLQGAGSVVLDNGGVAFIDAFTNGQADWQRLAALDGRPLVAWYPDLAAALLLTTLDGKVAVTDPKFRFGETVADPTFGGFVGPSLRYEWTDEPNPAGPILQRVPWSKRPAMLRRGGMGFLEIDVDEPGANLGSIGANARAVVVRYQP